MKYKLLALIPLIAITGCKNGTQHKNIVQGVTTINDTTMVWLQDTQTGIERVFAIKSSANPNFNYLKYGDTVVVCPAFFASAESYDGYKILNSGFVVLKYNSDSISARQKRARFAHECETFNRKKQEMLNTQRPENMR